MSKIQTIIVSSFAARALAVKTVSSNAGSSTPGIDKVIWSTDAQKMQAILDLKRATPGEYRAKPAKRVFIPKSNNPAEIRPLGIPTIFDRAVQQLYVFALEPIAQISGDPHSYGFRRGVGAGDALAVLAQQLGPLGLQ